MRYENALEPETALQMYYTHPSGLGNAEIKTLFDVASDSTVSKIKSEIRVIMKRNGRRAWGAGRVDTRSTYEYARLDLEELEELCAKKRSVTAEQM